MSKSQFLVTRYTHGSVGKFLSTVLQTSQKIDHWSAILQNAKDSEIFEQLTLEYVNRSFPSDHLLHLRMEPMVPYQTDLYSVIYMSGNDITLQQYLDHAKNKNDTRLLDCFDKKIKANLIFNKPQTPLFCDNSEVITVVITSPKEKQWLFDTLWSKHFLESNGKIYYLPNHPSYCNFASLPAVLRYNNPYCFPSEEKQNLFEQYVVNNSTNSWYFDTKHFEAYDRQHRLNNIFIDLEQILIADKFLSTISNVFQYFNLGEPNLVLIKKMHEIWSSRQFPYAI
jgi:hypothetical protein